MSNETEEINGLFDGYWNLTYQKLVFDSPNSNDSIILHKGNLMDINSRSGVHQIEVHDISVNKILGHMYIRGRFIDSTDKIDIALYDSRIMIFNNQQNLKETIPMSIEIVRKFLDFLGYYICAGEQIYNYANDNVLIVKETISTKHKRIFPIGFDIFKGSLTNSDVKYTTYGENIVIKYYDSVICLEKNGNVLFKRNYENDVGFIDITENFNKLYFYWKNI